MPFLIKRAADATDLPLPRRMSELAAGMDLYANVHEEVVIKTGERALIPVGIHTAIPAGYEIQVRPRSGLALNFGITIPNAPATVDADYRGELKVILMNLGADDFCVKRGDRVAQMVIAKVVMEDFTLADELPPSGRGMSGFGSTGF